MVVDFYFSDAQDTPNTAQRKNVEDLTGNTRHVGTAQNPSTSETRVRTPRLRVRPKRGILCQTPYPGVKVFPKRGPRPQDLIQGTTCLGGGCTPVYLLASNARPRCSKGQQERTRTRLHFSLREQLHNPALSSLLFRVFLLLVIIILLSATGHLQHRLHVGVGTIPGNNSPLRPIRSEPSCLLSSPVSRQKMST